MTKGVAQTARSELLSFACNKIRFSRDRFKYSISLKVRVPPSLLQHFAPMYYMTFWLL